MNLKLSKNLGRLKTSKNKFDINQSGETNDEGFLPLADRAMSATPDIDTVDQNEEELQRQSKLSK